MKIKKIGLGLSLFLSCVALAQFYWFRSERGPHARHGHLAPMQQSWIQEARPVPLGTFRLIDTQERAFGPEDLKGGWHLLLFGYTSCPDVCPTTLRVLAQALDALKDAGASQAPRAVFISVDPERDSPSRLSAYLSKIDEDIIGLTGPPFELKKLLHAIGSDYSIDKKTDPIAVNHPTTLFLINPQGRFVGLFTHPGRSARLKADIEGAIEDEERDARRDASEDGDNDDDSGVS